MNKVSFYGDMIYADGWFAYIEKNGKNSPLTREDARKVELEYRSYNASMDIDRGGMPPQIAYNARGLIWNDAKNALEVKGSYWVDGLAQAAQDAVIRDELVIPESVGGYKMNHIYRDSFQSLSIEKLVIPESVTAVASGAFSECYYLKDVQFGSHLDIASNAFYNCPFISFESGICYIGNTLFKATDSVNKNLVIPSNVTSISDRAFENNKTIESVRIPEDCKHIGFKAFCGCLLLKEVTFAGTVDEIGESAFENCPQLEKVELHEGLKVVPRCLFKDCKKLAEATIPASVIKVGLRAFLGTEIEKRFVDSEDDCLYVSDWLIDIKDNCRPELVVREGTVGIAESSCYHSNRQRNFRKVILPQSVKYLNAWALTHSKLEKLSLGAVEDIDLDAIRGNKCSEVHIPETCKRLTYWNFMDCPNIKDIYFHGANTFIEWPAITDRRDKASIRVHGYLGSTAEAYCKEYGEKYNLIFKVIE